MMKKYFLTITVLLSFCFFGTSAQQRATNSVKYMVTFDKATAMYTAWLVPNYSTPNFNNPNTEEKGATAQFSLKVPKGFELTNFQNIKGEWDKGGSKIGSDVYFKDAGVDMNFEYYIIGKSPVETNYGNFQEGEPVALFSFKGQTATPDKISVLENSDQFVDIAYNKLSLNVASSFYSRSGQAPKMDARPLEQFTKKADMQEVVKELAAKLGATESLLIEEADVSKNVLVYPNPADTIVNIKYFSLEDDAAAKIELFDQNGTALKTKEEVAKRGFNTAKFDVTNLSGSTYMIRTTVGGNVITKKVVKTN